MMASFWGFGDELFIFFFSYKVWGIFWLAPLSFPPSGIRATFSYIEEIFYQPDLQRLVRFIKKKDWWHFPQVSAWHKQISYRLKETSGESCFRDLPHSRETVQVLEEQDCGTGSRCSIRPKKPCESVAQSMFCLDPCQRTW